MSNIFRDSESFRKSNGKKWSKIWTFLFESGLKSLAKKNRFFLLILPWSTLLWHRCYYPHRSRDALSPVCGIFHRNIGKKSYRAWGVTGVIRAFGADLLAAYTWTTNHWLLGHPEEGLYNSTEQKTLMSDVCLSVCIKVITASSHSKSCPRS